MSFINSANLSGDLTPSPSSPISLPPTERELREQLKDFLRYHSDVEVLRHVLGLEPIPDAPALLDHAIINAIDCESNEWEHSKLTEIGLAAFDSTDMRAVTDLGPYAENLLKRVYFYHYRLASNAHLINKRFCPGDPTANRFGRTRFVSFQEAEMALMEAFEWPIDPKKPELGFCPVIFMGHAIGGDIGMLNDSLGFDASVLGTVVKTIDTQRLAREVSIPSRGHLIGLGDLCSYHGFWDKDAHTAGNDAAYTLICALLIAAAPEINGSNPVSNPDALPTTLDLRTGKSAQDVVDTIEDLSRQQPDDGWGSVVFCERCDSRKHFQPQCRARLCCQKCMTAGRDRMAKSHKTERCSWRG